MRLIDAEYLLYGMGMFSERENGAEFMKGAEAVAKMIEEAETVHEPDDWTPCAEGLPTKTADYKVTVQVGSEMGTWRETKIIPYRIVDGVGEWILPKSDWLIYGVIAWTKADEPWTGGLDGK